MMKSSDLVPLAIGLVAVFGIMRAEMRGPFETSGPTTPPRRARPRPADGIRRARLHFADDRAKLAWMQAGARRDARHPAIVKLASTLVRPFAPDDWRGQASEIQKFVRDAIRYQHDPDRKEELANADTVLVRGHDDCDGKARLFVALCRAVGMDAQIHPVWDKSGTQLDHVQGEVRYPGSHGWQLAEVTIKGVGLGEDPTHVKRNPETGKLPLS